MPKCVFDLASGRYVGGSLYGTPSYDVTSQILVELPEFPDRRTKRWDTAKNRLRDATAAEIEAGLPDVVEERWTGFEHNLGALFGGLDQFNTLAAKYPLFLSALRDHAKATLYGVAQMALGAGDITEEQYEALVNLARKFGIMLGV